MSYFSSTIAAVLAGLEIRAAFLVRFDFASQSIRVWQGHGPLLADTQTWMGAGELGKISGLESALLGTAPVVTFTLSGVDSALVSEAIGSPTEYKEKPVRVFLQFFDAGWAPLDPPYAIFVGRMDAMSVKASGPETRTIEVTAEGLFTRRVFPAWGQLSTESQRQLYPGDGALDIVANLSYQNIFWPYT